MTPCGVWNATPSDCGTEWVIGMNSQSTPAIDRRSPSPTTLKLVRCSRPASSTFSLATPMVSGAP